MIIIRGLNKAFGEKIIFSNFNLEIPDGSFVVISGDSGSGKSTLLNMIGGIEKPDSGSIIIEGLNITRLKNKNSFFADTVGFLFQNFALLENKTVKENLSLIKKSSRTKVSLKEALNRVGLSKEVNKKVYQLSGGEQQRVALARLMMKKCSVVLADEPTGALDSHSSQALLSTIQSINESLDATILMVTHDAFSASYANRILFLRDGAIFTEILKGSDSRRVFFEKILNVLTTMGGGMNDVR